MKEKQVNTPSEETIYKFLDGTSSEEETSAIRNWIHESDENARRLFRLEATYHLGKSRPDAEQKRLAHAEKLLKKRLAHEQESQRKQLYLYRRIRYAAAAITLFVIGTATVYLFHQNHADEQILVATAHEGIVKEVVLPDGTKVWLNNETTLTYPRQFADNERNVHIEGEAYFEVTRNPDKPFIVQSEAMRVRVLGTTFNFKSDKRYRIAEATLIEGEIEVKGNKEEGQIILAPGQRAELNKNNGRLTVKQVDAKMDAVWHDNLIPFQQADIFTIAKALERFYGARIILSPDIETDKTYSGVLKRKSDIESVLKSLQNTIPIDYKIVGSNIFIYPDKR